MQPLDGLEGEGFAAVLAAARAGDRRAIESLFRDTNPRLIRFLRSTEPRAADDIGGEVWLAVARGLAAFEGGHDDFRAWVFGIARRRLADHRRTAARRGTEPVAPDSLHVAAGGADPADLVGSRLSAQEAADLIVSLLPADQAEALLLRVLGQLDVAQVAEVMGRSANWVRVNQHRALRRLAQEFGHGVEEIPVANVIPLTPRTI